MDVSSAFPSQLLCEDLMLLFIHGGDGSLQLLRVLALVTALAPSSGAAAGLGSSICHSVQGDSSVYSPFLPLPTPQQRCGLREWQHSPNPRAIDLE